MESKSTPHQHHHGTNDAKSATRSQTSGTTTSPSIRSSFNSSVEPSSTPATLHSLEEPVKVDRETSKQNSPVFRHSDLVARLDTETVERTASARGNEPSVPEQCSNGQQDRGKELAAPTEASRTVSMSGPYRVPRSIIEQNPFLGGSHMQSNVRLECVWSHELSAHMRNGLDLRTAAAMTAEPRPDIETMERESVQQYTSGPHRSEFTSALMEKGKGKASAQGESGLALPESSSEGTKSPPLNDDKQKTDDKERKAGGDGQMKKPRKERSFKWLGLRR